MTYPLEPLGEVLSHYQEYIDAPEAKQYPKLSVKLYGRGVALDAPADGSMLKMKRHQLAKSGQVILSEIWGKKGAIGMVPPEGDGALCTSHFFLFDINKNRIEPRYLGFIFAANYLAEQLGSEAFGTTGYAAVRPKNLLKATIPLPLLPEQQRIVARVEAIAVKLSEARRLREESEQELDALTKATTRAVFSGVIGATLNLESVCSDIIDNLHSNPVYSEVGIPCIRSPDVGWGVLNLAGALRTDEIEYQRRTVRGEPQTDDIVLVREGGGTGKAARVQPGERFSLGQRVMMIRPDTKQVLPAFLLHQLLSPTIQDDHVVPLTKGSASPHLNIGALRTFPIVVPPMPDQQRLVAYLDELQAKAKILRTQQSETATELAALLPSVLSKAFAGEL